MSDKTNSALTDAGTLDGTEVIYVTKGGNSRRSSAGAVGSVVNVATRAALAAIPTPTLGMTRNLTELGREGVFSFHTGNYSTQVTGDTLQGIFVAPSLDTTGASGCWVRVGWSVLDGRYFGGKFDNVANDGPVVDAARSLSNVLKRASAIAGVEYGSGGGPAVYISGFAYMGSTPLVTTHSFRLFGDNAGLPAGIVSGLRWDDNVVGITINNTGLKLEGLALVGGFSGTEGEFHAILATATFEYRNLVIGYWGGDAMKFDCNIGVGNVDSIIGENVWVFNTRDAFNNVAGSNNSACSHKNWNVDTVRRWAFNENTFLGNGHDGHATANCGLSVYNDGVHIGCSVTSYSGNRYFAINGQEAWCSTHAPSGTTADNQGWAYLGAGGAFPAFGIIAWFNGILVRAGGSYLCTGGNLGSTWSRCYAEGGEGQAQINGPSRVMSPAMTVWRGSTAATETGTTDGAVFNPGGYRASSYLGTDETVVSSLGERSVSTKTLFYCDASVSFPLRLRLQITNGDLSLDYNGSPSARWYYMTGPTTTVQFGTGAAVPYAAFFPNLMIGADIGTARRMTSGATAPTTGAHGQGEICWNNAPAVGQPKGWMCTVAGTPGTWVSMGNL